MADHKPMDPLAHIRTKGDPNIIGPGSHDRPCPCPVHNDRIPDAEPPELTDAQRDALMRLVNKPTDADREKATTPRADTVRAARPTVDIDKVSWDVLEAVAVHGDAAAAAIMAMGPGGSTAPAVGEMMAARRVIARALANARDEMTADRDEERRLRLCAENDMHNMATERDDARAEMERRSLLWGALPGVCRQCGGPCEDARACYAVPTCFKCLPPPPPLETIDESNLPGGA